MIFYSLDLCLIMMRIYLKKFGTTLISRQAGRESLAAIQPEIKELKINENLEIDFDGVITFSPSWGDEFLGQLLKDYPDRLILISTGNPSVKATLEILEKISGKFFKKTG